MKTITLRKPKCRVSGCRRPAFSSGLCNMHLLRFKRTGETGSAKSSRTTVHFKRPSREKRAAATMRKLFREFGSRWVVSSGQGVVAIDAKDASPKEVARPAVDALIRRGWVEWGPIRADGSHTIKVTAAGVAVAKKEKA